jgi:hypothetical protein
MHDRESLTTNLRERCSLFVSYYLGGMIINLEQNRDRDKDHRQVRAVLCSPLGSSGRLIIVGGLWLALHWIEHQV